MRQGVRFGVVLGAALLLPVVATACSSGSSTAPLTAQQKSYVTSVRSLFSQDGTGHAQHSDGQLAEVGDSTCKLMKAGKMDQAYSALESSGYSRGEAGEIELSVVQTLCPDQRSAYYKWTSTPAQG